MGVSAFYTVVSFVSEDTLRHPPTRQYLSSCVEILGQVRGHNCCNQCVCTVAEDGKGADVETLICVDSSYLSSVTINNTFLFIGPFTLNK